MSLRKLTRLVMHQASGKPAALFIDPAALEDGHREFLKENGVVLEATCYKYEFPAFYEPKDLDIAKKELGNSCVGVVAVEWELW